MQLATENRLRYVDSHERSAEWLRLAIPLMSRQHAGLHPVSYAIWYEYVSGRNIELNREIDERLQHGEVLTDLTAHALYYNYLSGPDEQRAEHVGVALHQMMTEVSSHTEQSAQRVSQYGQSLSRIGSRLGSRPERIEIRADIEWILKDTAAVMGTMSGLHELLNASRTEIARLRQELARSKAEAETDALTGVLNRRAFDEVFETAIGHARAESAPLCLALFDIDHFKNVNDSYGHVFGDKVLRSVAKILKDGTKGADYVARFGGEEFAVLLPHTNLQNAARVTETLRGGIAMGRVRDAKGDILRKITASAGVGAYLENESAEEFVARVDAALYESKRRGRNRITVTT